MLDIIKKVLKDSTTGIDGVSYDLMKLFAAVGFFTAIGLQIFVVVWRNATFEISNFGTGLGILFVGLAGALKLKETTEPQATVPGTTEVTTTAIDTTTTTVSKP